MRKRVVVVLLVLAAFLGGLLVARGYPDWAINVVQREGTTFVVTGQVDANITNTEINARVTNSTITIEPAEGSEFVIKPAQDVVFTIQGDVNATIQGTASVSIDRATITVDVATLRERAPEQGKVDYASEYAKVEAGTEESLTVFENTLDKTVYLELASVMFYIPVTESGTVDYTSKFAKIEIYSGDGSLLVSIYVSPYTNVANFDPPIPIEPNGKIVVRAWNTGSDDAYVAASVVYRKP